MLAYLKALWSAVKRGSKTIIGAVVMLVPVAVDHWSDIVSALTGYGTAHGWAPWAVPFLGFALVLVGKAVSELREKERQP